MKNYVLAQSWNRSNVQDCLWYCMEEADKDIFKNRRINSLW